MERQGLVGAGPGALHDGGGGALLPGGTGPQAHLLAVAGVDAGQREAGVVVDVHGVGADQRDDLRDVLGDHVLVGAEAARRHDDVLAPVLDVALVGVLRDDAHHGTGLILDELLGHHVVLDLDAVLLGELGDRLDGVLLARGGRALAVAGTEGDGVVGAAVVDVVALEEDLDALVAHEVDEPVHGLLGVVVGAHPHLLVDGVGRRAHLLIEEGDRVEPLDAVLLDDLVVGGEVGAAAGDGRRGGGEQGDRGALLGRGGGRHESGHAAADDDDVVLDRLGDLLGGDGVGRNLERPAGLAVGDVDDVAGVGGDAVDVGEGEVLGVAHRGVGRHRVCQGAGGTGGGDRCHGGACEEGAAGELVHGILLSPSGHPLVPR